RYVNHAHNDVLEYALEAGAIGVAVMIMFVVWQVWRSAQNWLRSSSRTRGLDPSLAPAARLARALPVVHSFLDYPLRTAAMMGIFAFACGLLIEPISSDGRRVKHKNNETHSNMSRVPQQSADIASTEPAVAAAPRQPAARWGQNIDWPEAWRKPKLE